MTKFAQPGRRIDIGRDRDAFRLHVRETVLVAAASILRNDGPAALTLRRVAQDVGASTKVIYTTFGGKDGLFDALYLRSYAGLQAAMEMASSAQDAETRLRSICDAYRDYALAEPGFYNVMYGDLGRSWQAPPESRAQAGQTFRILREAVAAMRPSCPSDNVIQITRQLWAAMHGLVSLQMRGLLSDEEDFDTLFHDTVAVIYNGSLSGGKTEI
ncbi:TetR-like C-terminal domain-containing protein [Sphingomonas sp. VDB2]|uniref:TetR-like C-terminal domain-containing protein n=1 Tax=Sphingomonas sp. VDB2 TaxID=3228751 RepID=UPI003A7FD063